MISINTRTAYDWAYYWYYQVGVNPLPRIGKIPIITYKPLRNKRISDDYFNQWIDEGRYNDNLCCMIGKLSGYTPTLNYARQGLYLNFCDFDNQLAIDRFCTYKGHEFTLEQMAKLVFIVQHSDDKTHAHAYWISSKPMAKRTLDKDKKILAKIKANLLPSVEVKGQGEIAFCPGGYHESGNPYLPIGTTEILHIEKLNEHIHNICRNYNLPVSDSERKKLRILNLISKLKFGKKGKSRRTKLDFDFDTEEEDLTEEIYDGSRNNTLFDRARKYFRKHRDLLTADNFRKIVHYWNQKYCIPPLDDFEENGICNSILAYNSQEQEVHE